MSGAGREATQADFDLERFIKLMDQAMTSKDPRVKDALRSLLMIVALTDPEPEVSDRDVGPLRQLANDLWDLNRRIGRVEEEIRQEKYKQTLPQVTPWTAPATGPYTTPYTGPTWTSSGTGPAQIDTSTVSSQNNFKMPNRIV